MKTFKLFLAVVLSVALGTSAVAQTAVIKSTVTTKSVAKTEVFNVGGKCEMCKARIEKTAKVTGVSKATWDAKTKKLSLTYEPAKLKTDAVLKALAAVGHDSDKFKATDKVYNSLPGCCKYR